MQQVALVSLVSDVLILAGAFLLGAPVASIMRAIGRRGRNITLIVASALSLWVAGGIVISQSAALLPNHAQVLSPLRLGGYDFNLSVLAPMLLYSSALALLLAPSLVAAARGRQLGDCIRVAARRR